MRVEYGRRRALAIVLGDAPPPADRTTKPIADRVRTDGPLLPPLTLALARWVSEHYLAPPAATIRSFLPPAFLERLELRAERTPAEPPPELQSLDHDVLEQLAPGPRRVRDLVGAEALYRQALNLADNTLGRDHPDTAGTLNNLASLLEAKM